jgi:hypothetical protein
MNGSTETKPGKVLRQVLSFFGLYPAMPRLWIPSRRTLWLYAVLGAGGLALTLSTNQDLLHDLGAALFGGGLGCWLVGRKSREDARRESYLGPLN